MAKITVRQTLRSFIRDNVSDPMKLIRNDIIINESMWGRLHKRIKAGYIDSQNDTIILYSSQCGEYLDAIVDELERILFSYGGMTTEVTIKIV